MKLYEIILKKLGLSSDKKEEAATEPEEFYNPLDCQIGRTVKIDALDYREHRFSVIGIREYTVSMSGQDFRMTDYILQSRPVGGEELSCRLRVAPEPENKAGSTCQAIILNLYDNMAYNEGLHGAVKDESKKFVIDNTSPEEHSEYWRVNDVGIPYGASVKVLPDNSAESIEFWDYSRLTNIEGIECEEFVFVEMDKGNGWFKIWRGVEVDSKRVSCF